MKITISLTDETGEQEEKQRLVQFLRRCAELVESDTPVSVYEPNCSFVVDREIVTMGLRGLFLEQVAEAGNFALYRDTLSSYYSAWEPISYQEALKMARERECDVIFLELRKQLYMRRFVTPTLDELYREINQMKGSEA